MNTKKFNKWYKWIVVLTAALMCCAAVRTGHYYITEYNDNRSNWSLIDVESQNPK